MPHTCCNLDIPKIHAELIATSKEISDLKDKRREARLMPIDSAERTAILNRYDELGKLKHKVTLLCALRAQHKKRVHLKKFPYTAWGYCPMLEEHFNKQLNDFAKNYQRSEKVAA